MVSDPGHEMFFSLHFMSDGGAVALSDALDRNANQSNVLDALGANPPVAIYEPTPASGQLAWFVNGAGLRLVQSLGFVGRVGDPIVADKLPDGLALRLGGDPSVDD